MIRNNCLEFRNGFLDSYFFQTDFKKWLFGTLLLDIWYEKPSWLSNITNIQSFSNQSFKHNSTHMPSLNVTPSLFLSNLFLHKKQMLIFLGLFVLLDGKIMFHFWDIQFFLFLTIPSTLKLVTSQELAYEVQYIFE